MTNRRTGPRLLLAIALGAVGAAGRSAEVRRTVQLHENAGPSILGPYTLLPDPQTNRVFVAAAGSHHLAAVDATSGTVLSALSLQPKEAWTGECAYEPGLPSLQWAWGGKLLVAMNRGVWLVDPDTLSVEAHRSWGDLQAGPLAVGPDAAWVALTSGWYMSFALVERDTLDERATGRLRREEAEVGAFATAGAVAWDPSGGHFVLFHHLGLGSGPSVFPWIEPLGTVDPRTGAVFEGGAQGEGLAADLSLISPRRLELARLGDGTWRLSWSSWDKPDQALGSLTALVKGDRGGATLQSPDRLFLLNTGYRIVDAVWEPGLRRFALMMETGGSGHALMLVDAERPRIVAVTLLHDPVGDAYHTHRPKVWADWRHGRLYAQLLSNDGIAVFSASDLSPMGRWCLGTRIWGAHLDPWHGLLTITGESDGNLAWSLDRDLRLRSYGPRPGLKWWSFDAARGWVYTNWPSLHGSDGFYVEDVRTGEVIREVRYAGERGQRRYAPEVRAEHIYLQEHMAPDPERGVLWRVNGEREALEALDSRSGAVVETIRLPRSSDMRYASCWDIALDRRRGVAFVSAEVPDADNRIALWRVSLDRGRSTRLPDVEGLLGTTAVCPESGRLAASTAEGDLVFLDQAGTVEGALNLHPPNTVDDHRADPYPSVRTRPWRLILFSDFRRNRLLVVDRFAAVVYVVRE